MCAGPEDSLTTQGLSGLLKHPKMTLSSRHLFMIHEAADTLNRSCSLALASPSSVSSNFALFWPRAYRHRNISGNKLYYQPHFPRFHGVLRLHYIP
jgi:hypothetical protein